MKTIKINMKSYYLSLLSILFSSIVCNLWSAAAHFMLLYKNANSIIFLVRQVHWKLVLPVLSFITFILYDGKIQNFLHTSICKTMLIIKWYVRVVKCFRSDWGQDSNRLYICTNHIWDRTLWGADIYLRIYYDVG